MKIYTIYDRKGEIMAPPFPAVNNALAIRQFQFLCTRPGSVEQPNTLHDCPEDFALYYIGEFDDKTMKYTENYPATLLSSALDYVSVKE
ncbi:VP5 [Gokushovirus WZ-2015a]|nr:VP5 [Gokushovirus WZ-2015a]